VAIKRMMPKKKSLVANIDRRKKNGSSRSKQRSTVSKDAFRDMQAGWPKKREAIPNS
jgi:hypothetical protein